MFIGNNKHVIPIYNICFESKILMHANIEIKADEGAFEAM